MVVLGLCFSPFRYGEYLAISSRISPYSTGARDEFEANIAQVYRHLGCDAQ